MNWAKPRLAFLVLSALIAGAGSGGSAAEVDQSGAQPADPAASRRPNRRPRRDIYQTLFWAITAPSFRHARPF
jgi:hypothetical protein